MTQIVTFLLIALSFFLILAVPLYLTGWNSGKKIVFTGCASWITLLILSGFFSQT